MLFKHKHLMFEFWARLFSLGFYTFLPVSLWYFYNPFSLAPRQSAWCRDGPYKHRCLGSWCPPSDENQQSHQRSPAKGCFSRCKVGMPHEILNIVATVDGCNPAKQLRLVVFPIDRVLHIPGGAGFLPSTVCDFMEMISKHLKTVNVWIKCVIASLRSHLWNSQIFTTKNLRIIHKYWCVHIYIYMWCM